MFGFSCIEGLEVEEILYVERSLDVLRGLGIGENPGIVWFDEVVFQG